MALKIKYNAPVILTFTAICVAVMGFSGIIPSTRELFVVGGDFGSPQNPFNYFRLISHIAGHANWEHLTGNLTFILLIGPILEEKYGSKNLFMMMAATAFITGVFNILLFDTGLLGASGIVFMFIVLSSISNARSGEIPLTFILIAGLYIGKELLASAHVDKISQYAHIMGGICGAIFGFGFNFSSRPNQRVI